MFCKDIIIWKSER